MAETRMVLSGAHHINPALWLEGRIRRRKGAVGEAGGGQLVVMVRKHVSLKGSDSLLGCNRKYLSVTGVSDVSMSNPSDLDGLFSDRASMRCPLGPGIVVAGG